MDESSNNNVYRVTREEIRSFVERIENLNIEKNEISEQQKDVFAEAKSRGYDTRILRKVISMRKRDPQDLSEEEAILEIYKEALDL
jgi:uncharacterized protein (UPF0335 family)